MWKEKLLTILETGLVDEALNNEEVVTALVKAQMFLAMELETTDFDDSKWEELAKILES